MTIQQLGQYLWDLGFFMSWLHSQAMQTLSSFLQTLGMGLESGQASFPVKVGNAVQIGKDIAGLGVVFSFFKFLQPAQAFCEQLGAELAAGMGAFGPIRVGNEAISGSVASNSDGSDTITFTISTWPG